MLFELAWDNHGLTLDLTHIPDDILRQIVDWRNEKVEAENSKLPKVPR